MNTNDTLGDLISSLEVKRHFDHFTQQSGRMEYSQFHGFGFAVLAGFSMFLLLFSEHWISKFNAYPHVKVPQALGPAAELARCLSPAREPGQATCRHRLWLLLLRLQA